MAGIIAYPELELGGQADQTIKGHKGAIKKFIKFRQSGLVNDPRSFDEYSEAGLCEESTFLQYGNYLIEDARMKDGSLHMLSSIEQFMIRLKGVIYRRNRSNPIW